MQRETKLQILKCPTCNQEFTQNRPFQKFCSDECATIFGHQKQSKKRSETRKQNFQTEDRIRICPVCGSEFEIKQRARHQMYCSNKCKCKANRIIELDKSRFGGNKKAVLIRDNFKCVLCGSSYRLAVHHIDCSGTLENPNHNIENLVCLCGSCHLMVHMQLKKGNDILLNL